MMAMRQPPVSRRIVASVDRHMGANTYHMSSESAVARLQLCVISGISACAVSSAVAESA
jgi:hypothetical protein